MILYIRILLYDNICSLLVTGDFGRARDVRRPPRGEVGHVGSGRHDSRLQPGGTDGGTDADETHQRYARHHHARNQRATTTSRQNHR